MTDAGPGWTGGLPLRAKLVRAALIWMTFIALALAVGVGVHVVSLHAHFGGPEGLATLFSPERVEAWRLETNLEAPTSGRPELYGYPVLSGPVTVAPDVARELGSTLHQVARSRSAKLCAFMPGVLVRFTRGERTFEALLCFSCDQVLLAVNREKHEFPTDFDDLRPELVALVKRVFPADAAIQGLR